MNHDRKRNIWVRTGICALTLIFLMGFAACASNSIQPTAKITTPVNPMAGDITIAVEVNGFLTPKQGKIIYYMDTSVPVYYEHEAISKAGTYAVSTDTAYTWKNVAPGEHKFAIQLVDQNNSPLPLPVVDSITIQVNAPEQTPQVEITNLANNDTLPPGNILVRTGISNFIVRHEDMGVLNRAGEGHLIYYIDEVPPTDQGSPATTDTSLVSVSDSHLWKNVTQGKHTFSVQLVNNDDTPLQTPVYVTVTIDVKP